MESMVWYQVDVAVTPRYRISAPVIYLHADGETMEFDGIGLGMHDGADIRGHHMVLTGRCWVSR